MCDKDRKSIAFALLAGGKSRRMGMNKAELGTDDQKTFLVRAAEEMSDFPYKYLSVNKDQNYDFDGYVQVSDEIEGIGPMGALYSLLNRCSEDAVLMLGVDMPEYDKQEADDIMLAYCGEDILWARSDGKVQPLASIYSKKCLSVVEACIKRGDYRLMSLNGGLNVGYFDTERPEVYRNINTREEYRAFCEQKNSSVTVCDVRKYTIDGIASEVTDYISTECEVSIKCGETELMSTACSPRELEEFAIGYVYIEKKYLISDDMISIQRFDDGTAEINIRSGTLDADFLSRNDSQHDSSVFDFMKAEEILLNLSRAFSMTGNMHCTGLCSGDKVIYASEDISRHISVYKAVGKCIMNGDMPSGYYMCTTGRLPLSMVTMAYSAGIKVVVSRSAPTDKSVDYAKKHGMSLFGFAGRTRVNEYIF